VEWYHPGFDHHALMDEVCDLIDSVLGAQNRRRLTYRDAFREGLGIDPAAADIAELRARVTAGGLSSTRAGELDRDGCLDFLFGAELQPVLGAGVVCIHDFPAGQAALARIRDSEQTAERFEVFVNSVELANGYHELADPREQARRMESDIAERKRRGLPLVPVDDALLDALRAGLPDCSGVALGFDRLLMLAERKCTLAEVLAFPLAGP
jgi:lysyl-tRNA synthetase class 2